MNKQKQQQKIGLSRKRADNLFGIPTTHGSPICRASSYSSCPCFSNPPCFGSNGRRKATVCLPVSPSPRHQQPGASALRRPAGRRADEWPARDPRGRGSSATGQGSLPSPGRGASPPHRPGRPAGRMRATLPGVPATLPPPTPRACHFLPSPHLRPGSVSRSLVAAGESLLPPSYPLRGGSSGSSGRGRQRKKETDLIKFPETTTTSKRGPRWGGTPILPRPSPKA